MIPDGQEFLIPPWWTGRGQQGVLLQGMMPAGSSLAWGTAPHSLQHQWRLQRALPQAGTSMTQEETEKAHTKNPSNRSWCRVGISFPQCAPVPLSCHAVCLFSPLALACGCVFDLAAARLLCRGRGGLQPPIVTRAPYLRLCCCSALLLAGPVAASSPCVSVAFGARGYRGHRLQGLPRFLSA